MNKRLSVLVLATGLSACTVGPNYAGPPTVATETAFHRAGDLPAGPPLARWWLTLNDAELNRLEDAALSGSPTVAAAEARLRQSRAGLNAARANLWPTTGTSAAYVHADGLGSALGALSGGQSSGSQTSSGAGSSASASGSGSKDLELYSANFDAIWEVDLFGGTRRAIEGARDESEAAQAQLDDARVTLTAEVAQAYVQLRDLQQRLALAKENTDLESHTLDLTRVRRNGGTASDLDVERLTTLLETTRATIVPLQAQLAEQFDRLAVLTGQVPGALDKELGTQQPVPLPPATVQVGDPTSLLQRRPDIRAAERKLAQQTAAIGQQKANLFPKLTLIGTLGYGSTKLSTLFDNDNRSSIQAPLLQWTPFDFGRTHAAITRAEAARDEAEANYRQTVLAALQDAETSLSRYGRQRDAVADQARVEASASRAAQLTDIKVRGGTATTIDQLDAERSRIEAQSSASEAAAQLTQDYIALQKSLGLGWQPQS